jgi:hypothetical protein
MSIAFAGLLSSSDDSDILVLEKIQLLMNVMNLLREMQYSLNSVYNGENFCRYSENGHHIACFINSVSIFIVFFSSLWWGGTEFTCYLGHYLASCTNPG